MAGWSNPYPGVDNGTSTYEESLDLPPLSSLTNRRRGMKEGDHKKSFKAELSKRRMSIKRRLGKTNNGLNFAGLSISDINVSETEELLWG